MAKTDFEKKADQLRSQMEDLRSNFDDVLKGYNRLLAQGMEWMAQAQRPMAKAATKARENVEEVGEGMFGAGVPWWLPVAVVGFIGAGVWLYNMMTAGGTQPSSQPFSNFPAGSQPPMTSTETPFGESR